MLFVGGEGRWVGPMYLSFVPLLRLGDRKEGEKNKALLKRSKPELF